VPGTHTVQQLGNHDSEKADELYGGAGLEELKKWCKKGPIGFYKAFADRESRTLNRIKGIPNAHSTQ
jgi:hypothetical protein